MSTLIPSLASASAFTTKAALVASEAPVAGLTAASDATASTSGWQLPPLYSVTAAGVANVQPGTYRVVVRGNHVATLAGQSATLSIGAVSGLFTGITTPIPAPFVITSTAAGTTAFEYYWDVVAVANTRFTMNSVIAGPNSITGFFLGVTRLA